MANQRPRSVVVGLIGTGLVAALVWAFWPQPVAVDLAVVGRGPLRVVVDEEGETRVRDVYVVSAPVDGRLLRIESEVGDRVRAGQTVLASIQPQAPTFLDRRARKAAEARLRAAIAAVVLGEARVQRAAAELDFARAELRRAERLAAVEHISEEARDRARLEVRTGEAALHEAEAQLAMYREEVESARADLIEPVVGGDAGYDPSACCVEITAPVGGTVLAVHRESEQVVRAGTPLLEIGDPEDLEVVVDLLSTDVVRVRPGADATIEAWGGGDVLAARVRRVEPAGYTKVSALGIEEQRVDVILDFTEPKERRAPLGHGYRVEARIIVWEDDDTLRVPLSALFRAGEAWAVFVEEDGRAVRREIGIGHRDDRVAEVTTGLEAGDRVVLHPSDRVDDAVRIVPRAGGG
jgi:HlyD family secretion protein